MSNVNTLGAVNAVDRRHFVFVKIHELAVYANPDRNSADYRLYGYRWHTSIVPH